MSSSAGAAGRSPPDTTDTISASRKTAIRDMFNDKRSKPQFSTLIKKASQSLVSLALALRQSVARKVNLILTTRQEKTSINAWSGSFWPRQSGAFGGGEWCSLLSKRGIDPVSVKAGRVFRYDNGKGRRETATIVGLCDIHGMRHVRFELRIDQPGRHPFEDGPRLLGMKAFIEHFCERVGS